MRVIVTGGRNYQNYQVVEDILWMIDPHDPLLLVIIQGGQTGADSLAKTWAEENAFQYETFKADWDKHGKAAGPIRNQEMIDVGADLVIAFPGGKGTADCMRRAKEAKIPILQVFE